MRLVALPLVAAACFSPEARDGLPCSEAGHCPPGQSCQLGICSSEALFDASPLLDAALEDGGDPAPPGAFEMPQQVVLMCPGPVVCVDVRDPFMTTDSLLFTYGVAPGTNYDIYFAERTGETSFLQAASIGAINSPVSEHAPSLSADGTTLWFARQDLSNGEARPYDEILVSKRETGPFQLASNVEGGVDTLLGDERSPQVSADGTAMLFARSQEKTPTDHDLYLARLEGGQWNTIERLDALSEVGANERSLALVEERKAIFYVRDDQIHEALWSGDGPDAIAIDIVHEELDAATLDAKVGVWSSADGTEIWFDSSRGGPQQIYRAVRDAPTSARLTSGGRIRRRPIP